MTNGSLMKVESIAECSLWSILQYFWHALSDNGSWKPILVFLFDSLKQVLLYVHVSMKTVVVVLSGSFRMGYFQWLPTSWENLTFLKANNKGADQPAHLSSLISAFVLGKYNSSTYYTQNFNILASLCGRASWFESHLVAGMRSRIAIVY